MLDGAAFCGVCRLGGLTAVVVTNCSSQPWGISINYDSTWPMFASPAAVYLLFYAATVKQKHFGKVQY